MSSKQAEVPASTTTSAVKPTPPKQQLPDTFARREQLQTVVDACRASGLR
jgi:hypothetical protein